MAATATKQTEAKAPAKPKTNGVKANGNGAAKGAMSAEHKAALAAGRRESKVVSNYLEALTEHKPKRGRPRTVESIDARLDAIAAVIDDAPAIERLHLIQERSDLADERARLAETPDISAIEEQFVEVAGSYSTRKNIGYRTWRDMGVEPDVLQRAGIKRSLK